MADDKKDLTRIEDLSEYFHESDEEVDRLLNDLPPTPVSDLDSLPEEEETDSLPPTPFLEDEEETLGDEENLDFSGEDVSFDQDDEETFSFDDSSTTEGDEELEETDFSFGEEGTESSDDDAESFGSSFEEDFTASPSEDEAASEEESFSFDDQPSEDDFSDLSSTEGTFLSSEEVSEAIQDAPQDFLQHTDAAISMPSSISQPMATPNPSFKPENFGDVKRYASSISYGAMSQGGNPPFSVILRNIRFKEDCEDILLILKDHGLVHSDSEREMRAGLENGSLLISQLSEYCAIFLAHRLRRFDLEVQLGLSDELHPSKSYGRDQDRPINKSSLQQNKQQSYQQTENPIDLNSIIASTASSLPDYQVIRYLGVVSEHSLIDEEQIHDLEQAEGRESMGESYDMLTERLKGKVLRKGGNGLLSLSYQLTPLPTVGEQKLTYKITCTGTAVLMSHMGA